MMTFFLFRFLIVLFLGFTFSSSVIEGNLLDSLNSLIESEDAFVDGISLTSGDAAAGSSSGGSTLDETPSEETLVIGSQTDDSDLHSNCHILPAEIHVTKEDMDETGNVRRTCEGNIIVSKCEGTCRSELRPSVSSPTGLHKECFCCRESTMTVKTFELAECFSPDGIKLTDSSLSKMRIRLKEPSGCRCHNCGL